jgi:hypothetical protein
MSCKCGGLDKVWDAERERDEALKKLAAVQTVLSVVMAELTPDQLGRARERLDFMDVTASLSE